MFMQKLTHVWCIFFISYLASYSCLFGGALPSLSSPTNMLQPWGVFEEPCTRGFDPLSTAALGKGYYACQWQTIGSSTYLAVAGATTPNNIRVLHFNPLTGVITQIPGAVFSHNANIFSLAWFTVGSTRYLAAAGDVASGTSLYIFQFIPGTTPGTGTLINLATYNHGATLWSVAPLIVGTTIYIAVGGKIGPNGEGTILLYNPSAQSIVPVTSISHGALIRSLSWLTIGGSRYLAIGGSTGTDNRQLRIFQFSTQGTLTLINSFDFGNTVWSLGWLTLSGSYYLAVVGGNGTTGSNIGVFQFDPSAQTLLLIALFDHGNITMTQAWQIIQGTNYLTIGGGKNSNEQAIYARLLIFDQLANTLVPEAGSVVTNINTVWNTAWMAYGASFYLALAGFPTSDNITLRIYKYGFSVLNAIASFFYTVTTEIDCVGWQTINGTAYLAVCGQPNGAPPTADVNILTFDPAQQMLSLAAQYVYNNTFDYSKPISLSWYNTFLAVGGEDNGVNQSIQITQFVPPSTVNFITGYENPGGGLTLDLKWLLFNNTIYLAAGGDYPPSKALVFQFNGAALTLIASYNTGPGLLSQVNGVDWIVINGIAYLAVAGCPQTVGADIYSIYILAFDPALGTLTSIANTANAYPSTVSKVSWVTIDGIAYLAVGGTNTGAEVQIFQFSPTAGTLTLVNNGSFSHGNTIYSLSWRQYGGANYLAIGGLDGDPTTGTNQVRVLQFIPGTSLTALQSLTRGLFAPTYSVAFTEILAINYLGIGGFGDTSSIPPVQVAQFIPG